MYERSTIHSRQEKRQKVHASAKASDSQGMGTDWQWSRGCGESSNSSSGPLPLEKGTVARGRDFSERQAPASGTTDKGTGRGEPKAQRSHCYSDPRDNSTKKKNELWLAFFVHPSISSTFFYFLTFCPFIEYYLSVIEQKYQKPII